MQHNIPKNVLHFIEKWHSKEPYKKKHCDGYVLWLQSMFKNVPLLTLSPSPVQKIFAGIYYRNSSPILHFLIREKNSDKKVTEMHTASLVSHRFLWGAMLWKTTPRFQASCLISSNSERGDLIKRYKTSISSEAIRRDLSYSCFPSQSRRWIWLKWSLVSWVSRGSHQAIAEVS